MRLEMKKILVARFFAFMVLTANYCTIANYGSEIYPTADTGDAKAIYVWLSLASEGLMPETYFGTYYLQITDKA